MGTESAVGNGSNLGEEKHKRSKSGKERAALRAFNVIYVFSNRPRHGARGRWIDDVVMHEQDVDVDDDGP